MKKSKRFLCMLIAAVMLLGAFPAHAASVPPAATYKAASPARLPDGTTGATAGMFTDSRDYDTEACGPAKDYLFISGSEPGKPMANKTVYMHFNPTKNTLAEFAGKKIPGGCVVDVYDTSKGMYHQKFICQYDTRGQTEDFVIPCAPGDDPANPKPKKVTPIRTTFTDVQPDAWYYDAVTAVANGKVIHTVFDREADGSFKPNAPVTDLEWEWIKDRLYGKETEGRLFFQYDTVIHQHRTNSCPDDCIACKRGLNPTDLNYVCPGLQRIKMIENIGCQAMGGNLWRLKPSAYMKEHAAYISNQVSANSAYLETWLDKAAKGEINGGMSPANGYARNYEVLKPGLYRGIEAGMLVPEKLNNWGELRMPVTRAELCVMLYRAGTTEFGSWIQENQIARLNAINP